MLAERPNGLASVRTEIQTVREMSQGREADRLSDRLGFGHRLLT